jgi:hypothetical protein
MFNVSLNKKLVSSLSPETLKASNIIKNVEREDLVKLNEILDKLTQNGFFEYYAELRNYYEYLADKYHLDLKTHTIDPATGAILPINNKDKFYFEK